MLAFSTFTQGFAQETIAGIEERGLLYKKASHKGITFHSRGLGIHYRTGKPKTAFGYRFWDFSLVTMKHPKETKSVNPFGNRNSGYIYGKLNSLILLRSGYGIQKSINAKGDIGGVEVSYGLYGGLSLAFTKPVYLSIYYFNDDQGLYERIEKYEPNSHYPDNIAGRAPFTKGLNELRLSPGGYASFVINAEFGKDPKKIKIIETGLTVDVYSRPIEMMAFNPNTPVFFTLFVRLILGQKWTHYE